MRTTLFPTGKHKMMVVPGGVARSRAWVPEPESASWRDPRVQYSSRIGPEEIKELSPRSRGAGCRFGDRLEQAAAWLAAPGGWRLALRATPPRRFPTSRNCCRKSRREQARDNGLATLRRRLEAKLFRALLLVADAPGRARSEREVSSRPSECGAGGHAILRQHRVCS